MTQELALKVMQSGHNVFITGGAGTGKSYLLGLFREWHDRKKSGLVVTAPTGIAALNVQGRTIHSAFKLPPTRMNIEEWKATYTRDRKKASYIRLSILKIKTLVIDEISMVHADTLDLIDGIMQWATHDKKPFGGVQVIVIGDFFQLEPINKPRKKNDIYFDEMWEASADKNKFAWKSKVWSKAKFKTCYLTQKYRQSEGDKLVEVLDAIREGRGEDAQPLLHAMKHDREDTVKLYTKNVNVDALNLLELNKLDTEEKIHIAKERGSEYFIKNFYKNSLWQKELTLKVGALVMFIINDPMERYVNGSMGRIESYRGNTPLVRLVDGSLVLAEAVENEIKINNEYQATVTQIPLKLAWAITIHKSQGLTLESLEIDLEDVFTYGMGYVALSRAKSYEGINLIGYNQLALKVNPYSLFIDAYMKRASAKTEEEFRNV